MQCLKTCLQRIINGNQLFQSNLITSTQVLSQNYSKFIRNNKKFFPIQQHGEERRPAYVCHVKRNLKYSPKNMWYVANLIRGMTIDDAINQISFVLKKGGAFVKEALLEAQQKAVEDHNVEFKTNLWVSESYVTKGKVIKGMRIHAKKRRGEIRYTYCHYYVTLEEGKPPEHYYHFDAPKSKDQLLEEYKNNLRKRKIFNSL